MPRDLQSQRADEALEMILGAIKVPDLDLEPTEEEVDLFLSEEASSRRERGLEMEPEEAEMIGAMNRLNEGAEFSAETEERLERKRALLLKWMGEGHEETEA